MLARIAAAVHRTRTGSDLIIAHSRKRDWLVLVYFRRHFRRRATHMPRKATSAHKERSHRDFLQIPDFSAREIDKLFSLAEKMRAGKYTKKPLGGKSLAMIFMKA